MVLLSIFLMDVLLDVLAQRFCFFFLPESFGNILMSYILYAHQPHPLCPAHTLFDGVSFRRAAVGSAQWKKNWVDI